MPNCDKHEFLTEWTKKSVESPADWSRKKMREVVFFGHTVYSLPQKHAWNTYAPVRYRAVSEAERVFDGLAEKWRDETEHVSSTTALVMNGSYQQIIGLGRPALPLLLRELHRAPDHWFWALAAISRENPVTADDAGQLNKMTAAWLQWGKERDLI